VIILKVVAMATKINNGFKVAVTIDGVLFSSLAEASAHYGLARNSLSSAVCNVRVGNRRSAHIGPLLVTLDENNQINIQYVPKDTARYSKPKPKMQASVKLKAEEIIEIQEKPRQKQEWHNPSCTGSRKPGALIPGLVTHRLGVYHG
jgi:hypothetical protein